VVPPSSKAIFFGQQYTKFVNHQLMFVLFVLKINNKLQIEKCLFMDMTIIYSFVLKKYKNDFIYSLLS
jgi:hypothetical protein